MTEPIVSAVDLRRVYGEGETAVVALAGATVAFPRGGYTAVMGPSGSGKSTLMHLLAGLDRPTAGTVAIGGTELGSLDDTKLTRLRRDQVGFVFQAFNLVPVLNAEENVALPLTLAGRDVDRGWLEELLGRVGLGERRTHRPAELSGGQQQRVAVARALIHRPAVVFADEPTGNLDSRSGDVILELLCALHAAGTTIALITHDRGIAAALPRRVELRDGEIVADERAVAA